jgi:hypothetical protein
MNINQRAKDAAKYLVDESCNFQAAMKANTYDAWQAYLDSLGDIESSELAHTEADSWDVVIYTGKAIDLVSNTWSSDLDQAEESMIECGFKFESFGQTCCSLAYWVCYHAIESAICEYVEEMREFAASMQDNAPEAEEQESE